MLKESRYSLVPLTFDITLSNITRKSQQRFIYKRQCFGYTLLKTGNISALHTSLGKNLDISKKWPWYTESTMALVPPRHRAGVLSSNSQEHSPSVPGWRPRRNILCQGLQNDIYFPITEAALTVLSHGVNAVLFKKKNYVVDLSRVTGKYRDKHCLTHLWMGPSFDGHQWYLIGGLYPVGGRRCTLCMLYRTALYLCYTHPARQCSSTDRILC